MHLGKLTAVDTPVLENLLLQAKDYFMTSNSEFNADYIENEWRSRTARRALRDFAAYLRVQSVPDAEWQRYNAIYDQHRQQVTDHKSLTHVRITFYENSLVLFQEIKNWIGGRPTVYRLVANVNDHALNLSNMQLLIFALAFSLSDRQGYDDQPDPPTGKVSPVTVFQDYQQNLKPKTLMRHHYELMALTKELQARRVKVSDLETTPADWTHVSDHVIRTFIENMALHGNSHSTITVRLATIRKYAELAFISEAISQTQFAEIVNAIKAYIRPEKA